MPVRQRQEQEELDDPFSPDRTVKLRVISSSCPLCSKGILAPFDVKGCREDLTFYLDQCIDCKVIFTRSWNLRKSEKVNSWRWKSIHGKESKEEKKNEPYIPEIQRLKEQTTELGLSPSHDLDGRTGINPGDVTESKRIELGSDSNNRSR